MADRKTLARQELARRELERREVSIGRTQEVEERIAGRQDILATLREEPEAIRERLRGQEISRVLPGQQILPAIIPTAMKAVGGAFQRAEAGVAAPILQAIRQPRKTQEEEIAESRELGFLGAIKRDIGQFAETGREALRGLRGERLVERGDIFRELGFPEPAAATLGVLTDPFIVKSFFQKGGQRLATRVLQQGDDLIDDVFSKAVKPTVAGKVSFGLLQKARGKTREAIRTIVENKQNLEFVDDVTGQVVKRLPQNLDEFSQAINQTQRQLWDDAINPALKATKKAGVLINGDEIAGSLDDVIKSKSLRLSNPRIVEKAKELQNTFLGEKIDPLVAQDVLTDFNRELTRFFSTPGATFFDTTEAALKAQLARKTREILNREVNKITGKGFAMLKSKYGALASIEKDVSKAVIRNAKKSGGIVSSFADILATGNVARGITALKPGLVAAGIGQKLISSIFKRGADANRLTASMFRQLDILNQPQKLNLLRQFGIGVSRAKAPLTAIGMKEIQK